MKKLAIVAGISVILIGLLGCVQPQLEEVKTSEESADWYMTPLIPWGFNSLLPDVESRIIDGDESFYIEMKGDLEGSIVFNLTRHTKVFPSDWQPRLVELYNDRIIVTIPDYAVWSDVATGWGKGALSDTRKLDNGNYLFVLRGKGVFETEKETGRIIRFYEDIEAAHTAELLDNGNLLITAARVDKAYEVTWGGEIVWIWDAKKQIKPYDMRTVQNWDLYPHLRNMYYEWRQGTDWTPINHVQKLDNGNYLLSLKNQDLVLEVTPENEVVWTYGPLVLNHQHTPIRLENGNTLIHDTGNNRVIEVSPDHRIVWSYNKGMYSPVAGSSQRLPNGNTIISDWLRGSAWEIMPGGEVVWEMVVKAKKEALREDIASGTVPGIRLFRAWWYPD